jgi:hypothetical protein
MGVVYGPKDLLKGKIDIIKKGLRDIIPETQEEIIKILQNWEGDPSNKKLINLLGKKKTQQLKQSLQM